MGIDSQTGVDEEEELKMKIVLYYHTLVSFNKSTKASAAYIMSNKH